jgi:hypothetical protein
MKMIRSFLIAVLFAPSAGFGAVGIFDAFAFTRVNGGGLNFYDVGAATGNPDFQSAVLGTFNRFTDTLELGGQQKSFKNDGSDVTSHSIWWRIQEVGGSFTSVAMPWQFDLVTPGDQQWGGDSQGGNADPLELSSNVFAGLLNGTYTLQVFTQITTNGVNAPSVVQNNNGGSFFNATFTLVPEPSRALFLMAGISSLSLRRRRA